MPRDADVTVVLQNACYLVLQPTSHATATTTYIMNLPAGSASHTVVDGKHTISFRSARINMAVPDGLAQLSITALGSQSQVVANSIRVEGGLHIDGLSVNVRADAVSAAYIDAFVNDTGTLEFRNVVVTDLARGVVIDVSRGDVMVSPSRQVFSEISLAWNNPCGYVCLPHGRFVDDSHCAVRGTQNTASNNAGSYAPLNISANGTRARRAKKKTGKEYAYEGADEADDDLPDVNRNIHNGLLNATVKGNNTPSVRACNFRSCEGYYANITLLPSNATMHDMFAFGPVSYGGAGGTGVRSSSSGEEPGTGTTGVALELDIRVHDGSIYVHDQWQRPPSPFVASSSASLAGMREQNVPVLLDVDDSLKFELENMGADMSVYDDLVFLLTLKAAYAEDSVWFYSNKGYYEVVEPKYLSLLSAGLLAVTRQTSSGNLQPGFCPYTESLTEVRRGQVERLLKDRLYPSTSDTLLVGARQAQITLTWVVRLTVMFRMVLNI